MFKVTTPHSATGYTWSVTLEVGNEEHLIAASVHGQAFISAEAAASHAGRLLANMLADAMRTGMARG